MMKTTNADMKFTDGIERELIELEMNQSAPILPGEMGTNVLKSLLVVLFAMAMPVMASHLH